MSLPVALRRVAAASLSVAAVLGAMAPTSTQTAVANGDTRTLYLTHAHTGETITATYRVNGSFDPAVLEKLNYFLRDWRNDAVIKMDPRLFDVVWETHRGAGSTSPIRINSAYRSPETNSMLRRRSRGVAEFSLHTRGMAMDIHVPDVTTDSLRHTAIRMQRGGVGFYPSSGFVHLDVGNVRAWPRMRYDQLARIFPDGKSIHIAADGRTLPGYEEARLTLAARNGSYAPSLAQVKSKGFFATLFGWEDPDDTPAPAATPSRGRRAPAPTQVAAYAPEQPRSPALARAEANRPRGETFAGPASVAATPQEAARAAVIASVPMPPRRPVETVVASITPAAPLLGPLPPVRPSDFSVASIAPLSAPLPPARAVRAGINTDVASLFGSASGRIAATPGLPPVITEGAEPMAAAVLAYAPQQAPVRMIRQARTAPVAAQPVGLRAARNRVPAALTPARLDRSNFIAMTAPISMESATSGSTLGSSLAPLRPAARREARDLMFGAPQGNLVVSELRPRP
ncbi:MAG: DUF882 domain-containing protein [Beijerinckiaceae bacterium]|nr:DUF882 domain-containing protein [Beijerinckiaceae bacterium]